MFIQRRLRVGSNVARRKFQLLPNRLKTRCVKIKGVWYARPETMDDIWGCLVKSDPKRHCATLGSYFERGLEERETQEWEEAKRRERERTQSVK